MQEKDDFILESGHQPITEEDQSLVKERTAGRERQQLTQGEELKVTACFVMWINDRREDETRGSPFLSLPFHFDPRPCLPLSLVLRSLLLRLHHIWFPMCVHRYFCLFFILPSDLDNDGGGDPFNKEDYKRDNVRKRYCPIYFILLIPPLFYITSPVQWSYPFSNEWIFIPWTSSSASGFIHETQFGRRR